MSAKRNNITAPASRNAKLTNSPPPRAAPKPAAKTVAKPSVSPVSTRVSGRSALHPLALTARDIPSDIAQIGNYANSALKFYQGQADLEDVANALHAAYEYMHGGSSSSDSGPDTSSQASVPLSRPRARGEKHNSVPSRYGNAPSMGAMGIDDENDPWVAGIKGFIPGLVSESGSKAVDAIKEDVRKAYARPSSLSPYMGPHAGGPPVSEVSSFQSHTPFERTIATKYGPGIRVRGRQALCTVENRSAADGGNGVDCLHSYTGVTLAGPNCFRFGLRAAGGRLAALAQLYTRWDVEHVHFVYVPACPTTQPGQLALGFSDDPNTINTGVTLGFLQILNYANSCMTPPWQAGGVMFEQKQADWLFVDGIDQEDERFQEPGALFAYMQSSTAGTPPIPATTEIWGTIFLCYDLNFAAPSPSYRLVQFCWIDSCIGSSNIEMLLGYLIDRPDLVADILAKAMIAKGITVAEDVPVHVPCASLISTFNVAMLQVAIDKQVGALLPPPSKKR